MMLRNPDYSDENVCVYCGAPLSEKQIREIARLKESSAHCFARGACTPCWEAKHAGKEVLKGGPARTRQKTQPYF